MTDLSRTIAPKSDQLNSDDLLAGERTIKITRVSANEGSAEQPINVYFEGDGGKPYRPCKSMRRVMVAAWGNDGQQYVGRSMTLYRDPEVMFGGMKVGGIRISEMSHIDRDMTLALTASKAQRKPYTVKKMTTPEPRNPPAPNQGLTAADLEALKQRARNASQHGTVTFRAFWTETLTKEQRQALAGDLEKLKAAATDADRKGAPTEADPFTVPGDDVRLDQDGDIDDGTGDLIDDEDRARAQAEAEREIQERDRAQAEEG